MLRKLLAFKLIFLMAFMPYDVARADITASTVQFTRMMNGITGGAETTQALFSSGTTTAGMSLGSLAVGSALAFFAFYSSNLGSDDELRLPLTRGNALDVKPNQLTATPSSLPVNTNMFLICYSQSNPPFTSANPFKPSCDNTGSTSQQIQTDLRSCLVYITNRQTNQGGTVFFCASVISSNPNDFSKPRSVYFTKKLYPTYSPFFSGSSVYNVDSSCSSGYSLIYYSKNSPQSYDNVLYVRNRVYTPLQQDVQRCEIDDPSTNPVYPDHIKDIALMPDGKFQPMTDLDTQIHQGTISPDGTEYTDHGYILTSDGRKIEIYVDVKKQALADANADYYQSIISYVEHKTGACASDPVCSSLGTSSADIQGSYDVIKQLQIDTNNGTVTNLQTNQQVGHVAPSGSVYQNPQGQTQTVQPNQLIVTAPQPAGSTSPPQQQTTYNPLPSTQTSSSTGTGTGTGSIQFPSDYARTGEAKTASDSINKKIDDTFTVTPTSLVDPALPAQTDFSDNFFKGTFDGLKAFTLPAHTATCPTYVEDVAFKSSILHIDISAHCTVLEKVRSTVSNIMMIIFTLASLFIVLGA